MSEKFYGSHSIFLPQFECAGGGIGQLRSIFLFVALQKYLSYPTRARRLATRFARIGFAPPRFDSPTLLQKYSRTTTLRVVLLFLCRNINLCANLFPIAERLIFPRAERVVA
jgi:hypothetical protein